MRTVTIIGLTAALACGATTSAAAKAPWWQRPAQASEQDGDRWWAHVAALAADSMEGRGTGTPGHERSAAYVIRELEKLGLERPDPDSI